MEDENIEKSFHILTNSALSGREEETEDQEGEKDEIEVNLKELFL